MSLRLALTLISFRILFLYISIRKALSLSLFSVQYALPLEKKRKKSRESGGASFRMYAVKPIHTESISQGTNTLTNRSKPRLCKIRASKFNNRTRSGLFLHFFLFELQTNRKKNTFGKFMLVRLKQYDRLNSSGKKKNNDRYAEF